MDLKISAPKYRIAVTREPTTTGPRDQRNARCAIIRAAMKGAGIQGREFDIKAECEYVYERLDPTLKAVTFVQEFSNLGYVF